MIMKSVPRNSPLLCDNGWVFGCRKTSHTQQYDNQSASHDITLSFDDPFQIEGQGSVQSGTDVVEHANLKRLQATITLKYWRTLLDLWVALADEYG
jgi:hypothetical protein